MSRVARDTNKRPPVEVTNTPSALQDHERWVVWKLVHDPKRKKPRKVPQCPPGAKPPEGEKKWSWKHSECWLSFVDALALYKNNPKKYDGIGFVMLDITEDVFAEPIIGIDVDDCIDESGNLNDVAKRFIREIPTYWEISPTGTGIRGFCTGSIKREIDVDKVEIYDGSSTRYLTLTGRKIDGSTDTVQPGDQTFLDEIIDEYAKSAKEKKATEYGEMPVLLDEHDALHALDELFEVANEDLQHYITTGLPIGRYDHDGGLSEVVAGFIRTAYLNAFDDSQVLSMLWYHEHTQANYKTERGDRRLDFFWQECCRCRGPVVADDFDFLTFDEFEDEETGEPFFHVSELEGLDIPEPDMVVEEFMRNRVVTSLYGDGGIGKSLLSQQLQTCVEHNLKWLGREVKQGPTLGIYCEDDREELHRRQRSINRKYDLSYKDSPSIYFWSRVGEDNTLATFDNKGTIKSTSFLKAVHKKCLDVKPVLLILDPATELFGGNEINKRDVRQFVNRLTKLARRHNMAVLLLAHPSQSGMASGAGYSGSVDWNAAVRSRLYMTKDKHDDDTRYIEHMKSNYSKSGSVVQLMWHNGCFLSEFDIKMQEILNERAAEANQVFLEYMRECELSNIGLAVKANAEGYFATRFAKFAKRDGFTITVEQFKNAADDLELQGRIEQRSANRRQQYFLITGGNE